MNRERGQTGRVLLAWDKVELMVAPERPGEMGLVRGEQTQSTGCREPTGLADGGYGV